MKTFTKLAAALVVAGITAVSMASPSQAAWRHHAQNNPMTTGQAYQSNSDARSALGSYDYVPLSNPSAVNEAQCGLSPASPAYVPCTGAGD